MGRRGTTGSALAAAALTVLVANAARSSPPPQGDEEPLPCTGPPIDDPSAPSDDPARPTVDPDEGYAVYDEGYTPYDEGYTWWDREPDDDPYAPFPERTAPDGLLTQPFDGYPSPGDPPIRDAWPLPPPPAGPAAGTPYPPQATGGLSPPPPRGAAGVGGPAAYAGQWMCRGNTVYGGRGGNGGMSYEAMLSVDASGWFQGQGAYLLNGEYIPFSVEGRARIENGMASFNSQAVPQGRMSGAGPMDFQAGGTLSPDGRTLSYRDSGPVQLSRGQGWYETSYLCQR